jgi:hypothetical protein
VAKILIINDDAQFSEELERKGRRGSFQVE